MLDLASSLRVEGRDRGLQPYVRAIRAHRLLIAVITLAALAVAVLLVAGRGQTYEASAKLLVKPIPAQSASLIDLDVLRDTGDPTRTTQTAAALIDTQPAARGAAQRLGGKWTPESVLAATDVVVQGESNVLEVVGRDSNPKTAAALANAFATSALAERRQRVIQRVAPEIARTKAQLRDDTLPTGALDALSERLATLVGIQGGDPTIVLAESAFPPTAPNGVPRWLIVALSAVAGFVLAVGAALLLESVDPRVRDEDDVLKSFPAPLLAAVPSLTPGERRAAPQSPLKLPPRVRESYRTLLVQLDQAATENPTIMFTSASKGEGKTTSALHLALVLAEQGWRVILMDLDFAQSELTHRLELRAMAPRASQLVEPNNLRNLLAQNRDSQLQMLPAPRDLAVSSVDTLLGYMPNLLEQAKSLADYVVIDTPALGEVSDALRIARHVDHTVMLARPGVTNKRQLETAYELLKRAGVMIRGVLIVGSRRIPIRAHDGGVLGRSSSARRNASWSGAPDGAANGDLDSAAESEHPASEPPAAHGGGVSRS